MSVDPNEPIDELLEHTSGHTLKLNHIDEGVNKALRAIDELSETVTAGLLEVRNISLSAAQAGSSPRPTKPGEEAFRSGMSERLDELEKTIRSSHQRQGGLLLLVGLQFVAMLAVGAWLVFKPAQDSSAKADAVSAAPAAPTPTPAPAAAAPAVTSPPASAPEISIPKKKRRR